ncbi:thymidylate synthase [Mycoplasma sp. SG1]|uniref:thymidylate synthase n=1 Tax=Mycoplasma sp. SG1 TaxID=2810348 RepID=UPI002024E0E2|nr:thymidylate synthase [Mycoplasma sp. SG1]URM52960.1 thymidylate synthase [Mycoplasma sp. SG1]
MEIDYLNLCKDVLDNGFFKDDRTQTGTKSVFGRQLRFNINKSFPLLTTKKVFFKAICHELIWFIKGSTNIKYLVDNDVNIWNEWPFQKYRQSLDYQNETIKEFIQKIKSDNNFAKQWGELGPVYGFQWRNFNGQRCDQLKDVIEMIKTNPNSRRLIVTAWNPVQIKDMLLPPCHLLFQFYVTDNKYLSCQLYQRSADLFLGVPFNIASYSLLTYILAKLTNLEPLEFVHTIGDAHIYTNHIPQIKEQITRKPYQFPILKINANWKTINDVKFEDFEIIGYQHHKLIKGKVSV